MGIIDTLKNKWVYGSMLVRLIYINVAFFALLHIATLVLTFTDIKPEYALTWIELPSSPDLFITQPWTIITYMFAQYDLLHILFNMLWLYWFGTIFLLTDTSKRMLALYIYGGICGGALFMAVYNLVPAYNYTLAWLIGSSASVIAIVTATAVMHPDYKVGLLFFGPVALKWIAIITIAIDFFSITGDNGGGHIAHIGGALTGVIYAVALKHGTDITKPFNPVELLARVRSQLRRYLQLGGGQPAPSAITVGAVTIDDDAKRVTVDGDSWQAVSNSGDAIELGARVRVTGYDSIILTVKPVI